MARKARLPRERFIPIQVLAATEAVLPEEILRRAIRNGIDVHIPIPYGSNRSDVWNIGALRAHALGMKLRDYVDNAQQDQTITLVDEDIALLLANGEVAPEEAGLLGLEGTVSPIEFGTCQRFENRCCGI